MNEKTRTDSESDWKQRFRAASIPYSVIASGAPERGIAVTNQGGQYQVFAWELPSGQLSQRTNRPEGLIGADISPDGEYIYYLDDQLGNEIGHFVRLFLNTCGSQQAAHTLTSLRSGPFLDPD